MQAKVFEYFSGNFETEILITEDDKEAILASHAAGFAGVRCFVLPDFRAKYGDDLRSFSAELFELSGQLNEYHKFDGKKLLISPFHTLLHKLPTKKHLENFIINFGDNLDLKNLAQTFMRFGYESVDIVESEGEFSIRSDIVDVFGVGFKQPVRILFFDTEVESIRYYDTSTQLSKKDELENVCIIPKIASLSAIEYEKVNKNIQNFNSDVIVRDINSLGFWAIDDFDDYLSIYKAKLLKKIDFDAYGIQSDKFKGFGILNEASVYSDLQVSLSPDFFMLNSRKKIEILARNDSLFRSLNTTGDNIIFTQSPFILNITSNDHIIVSLNKLEKKKRVSHTSLVIDELKPNDYVVHEEYGIGQFVGLETISVLGATREFVVINYQNNDRLLLPVENLNMIDRYIASNGSMAVLDKLGKASFAKLKEKVREKLFIIASKIIAIAAKRELVKGVVLSKDEHEYLRFLNSAGFIYTSDQQTAVDEIFTDLKSGMVMDRLLSGDVGFGKTEVAMNAIFACVKSGYQALFFVPTTLLSAQHYKSLKDRFSSFNIEIYRLDRFTSAKEKASLKKALDDGRAVVCVGTHALLNLKAPNIGLIVVDEEHKFGVKQKEQLKEISSTSHVLSMSATPIPRSLNMALSKIKSYSSLKTPPSSRLDVRTSVKEFDDKLIKEAILREIRRAGQIFYIHNHIADMPQTEKFLKKLLPSLRILTLHSKIPAKTTEEEMIRFENGEYDVLLCTSIVESGIHLPNANTIIVENANKFGMADLHQLRGRVGRGDKQAYCYFLIEDKSNISEDALKRLIALQSNSSLGSGAILAYHDLEIRGGGNIVGEAQSGHIEAIGYSLYLKMLEDEINKILNQNELRDSKVELKLGVNAYLNAQLISEDRLRLELYRRLSKCDDINKVYEISSEIEDRFGKLDIYTKQFLDLIMIKILCSKCGYKAISNAGMNIVLTDKNDDKIRLKSRSMDDDDILAEILVYLRSKVKDKN